MTERRGGLGRGLAALIPTGPPRGGPLPAAADASAAEKKAAEDKGWFAANGQAKTHGGEVAGAVYREIPVSSIKPNPKQPRQVFDEEALAELEHSIREFGLLQPIVVRELGNGRVRARHGRAAAGGPPQQAGLEAIPAIVRETADDADAARRAAGEHPPRPAEPAGRGGRLPAAAGGVRRHPRGAGQPDRPQPAGHHQHDPAAEAAAAGAAPGRRRRPVRRARPRAARRWTTPRRRRSSPRGSSPRACRSGRPRRPSRWPKREQPAKPKRRAAQADQAPGLQDLADRLSDRFDTRVKVELGRRKGRIVVEFGSVDDLERIVGSSMAPEIRHRKRIRDRPGVFRPRR